MGNGEGKLQLEVVSAIHISLPFSVSIQFLSEVFVMISLFIINFFFNFQLWNEIKDHDQVTSALKFLQKRKQFWQQNKTC